MNIYAVFDMGANVPQDILCAMVDAAGKFIKRLDHARGLEESMVVEGHRAGYDEKDPTFGVSKEAAKNIVPVYIFSDPDVPDAGGYHDEDPHGRAYGKVFTKPYLDNGGTWIDGKDAVSVAFTHEIGEIEIDRPANEWYMMPDGRLTAKEACDAVEDTFYNETTDGGRSVAVSNFLLDNWGAAGSEGPYDYLGLLQGPFTMTEGGYWLIAHAGRIKQEFGPKMADWKKDLKTRGSRLTRRVIRLAAYQALLPQEPKEPEKPTTYDPNTAALDLDDPQNRMKPRVLLAKAEKSGLVTLDRAPTTSSGGIRNTSTQKLGTQAAKPTNNSNQKLGRRKW